MILGQYFMWFSHPGIFFAMLSQMMHLNGCHLSATSVAGAGWRWAGERFVPH